MSVFNQVTEIFSDVISSQQSSWSPVAYIQTSLHRHICV